MNGCAVINCTCSNLEQDKLHGVNRRVANYKGGSDSTNKKCICTVCGRETSAGNIKVEKPKGK